jgi:hypothetical protein
MYSNCSVSIILCTSSICFYFSSSVFIRHWQNLVKLKIERRDHTDGRYVYCIPEVHSLIRLELNTCILVCLPAGRFPFRLATTKQALSVEVEALCSLRAACRLNFSLFCLQLIRKIIFDLFVACNLCGIYSTKLSVAQATWRRIVELLMNDELEGI